MLDTDDKKVIDKQSLNLIVQALEEVVFPKIDELKVEIGGLKQDVGGLKQDVSDLKTLYETLDDSMTGVKMRLSSVENKVDILIDSSIDVKLLKNRVVRLEKAVL